MKEENKERERDGKMKERLYGRERRDREREEEGEKRSRKEGKKEERK